MRLSLSAALLVTAPALAQYGDINDLKLAKPEDKQDVKSTPPPKGAIVLFDGKDLSQWRDASGSPSGWIVKDGVMIVPPDKTPHGGDIFTKAEFGDIQLHLEFATPTPPKGDSQERGNSGVFFLGEYELQVLDSYHNRTYADGGAASLYASYRRARGRRSSYPRGWGGSGGRNRPWAPPEPSSARPRSPTSLCSSAA